MDMSRRYVPNKFTLFLRHVDTHGFNETVCWEYLGASKGNGYGHVNRGRGKTVTAHHLAYELFIGPVPKGLEVCHTCDTRFCVNPDHLFAGTRQENVDDMMAKGRQAGPARKHLKEDAVQEIRQRLAAGHCPRKISNQMGVSYERITAIRRGETYGS